MSIRAVLAAALLFGGGVALYSGYKKKPIIDVVPGIMKPTLGTKNNNPLNIRYNPANKWQGMTGQNKGYCTFESSVYGIRAGAVLMKNYITKYGLTSVKGLVNRWAPPSDNNPTQNYINYVAKRLGVSPNTAVLQVGDIPSLIKAMIHFENGMNPYSDETILKAVRLAGIDV
ncbi:structural protein P5 [Photobacterium damselae]|nr:structural protein P5 [Photobacterium damselae]MCG9779492.1 structural protein P5 [Photobacterium damselae]